MRGWACGRPFLDRVKSATRNRLVAVDEKGRWGGGERGDGRWEMGWAQVAR